MNFTDNIDNKCHTLPLRLFRSHFEIVLIGKLERVRKMKYKCNLICRTDMCDRLSDYRNRVCAY